jgi:hypothetical protein
MSIFFQLLSAVLYVRPLLLLLTEGSLIAPVAPHSIKNKECR